MSKPNVNAFFDEATFTITYVVADPTTGRAAVVDPVLDFDPASGRTSTTSADKVIEFVKGENLEIDWILETHVHADHLSGTPYIREQLGGKTAIGANVTAVQKTFKGVFNLKDLATDGSQFDHLFADDESFDIGAIAGRVIATPGHTPACITYVIGDAAFVGDTLFMPDFGSARTDFPGGDATQLYESVQKILSLPDETRLFMCHDYKAPGRDVYAWETSVAEQRASNIHINDTVSREAFVEMREGRDSQLGMPKLILPSLQVNLCAGRLPEPEDNDIRYLKIPLNAV
ncbi:MAG: MBL fold metallo-hydrolase [Gammaproteobacteria bacterium]|jgi:glyoxylase-like metal-dependent hydrolase (beta-lactamase superfamily II)|nr:MBL fold metallo-hydrolase [Gammaproteobacteria bacterium]MDH3820449.1 MBL fold metallo-hydrolase [Gammaproteobacteria bacterium]MDH3982575.1 MBL fold metallo-hydrolase [Gammaproteobacteria bacterium]